MTPAAKKELVQLAIRAEAPAPDAWWDFERLTEDGVITVDVHHGWDFTTTITSKTLQFSTVGRRKELRGSR